LLYLLIAQFGARGPLERLLPALLLGLLITTIVEFLLGKAEANDKRT